MNHIFVSNRPEIIKSGDSVRSVQVSQSSLICHWKALVPSDVALQQVEDY